MKLLAAHTSPTLAATLAAGTISLAVFLLPGAGIQSVATPLLPAFGSAAGRVPANLPVVHARRSRPVVHHASVPAHVVLRPEPRVAPRRRAVTPTAHAVHRRVHVRRVEHRVLASVTPAARTVPPARGNRVSHDRGHHRHTFALAPRVHGHGRALGHWAPHGHGHGYGRGHGRGEGHGTQAPAASTSSPTAPTHGSGAGNGHKKGDR